MMRSPIAKLVMISTTTRCKLKMGVAKYQALLRDVPDYNEQYRELATALASWDRELTKATEFLDQAMDILNRRGTQLDEEDLSVLRPPPMARISSGLPPWGATALQIPKLQREVSEGHQSLAQDLRRQLLCRSTTS